MGILIDSSVLIAWERGPSQSTIPTGAIRRERFCDFGDHRIGVAPWGSSRRQPGAAPQTRGFVEGLLARLPVISFDAVAARIHARLSAELAASGTAVGPHDLIIAATALTKGYIVTTRDERSFPRIPGLSYQRW
jgi:tRNA(fMet)-specific endonuclease VapC